MNFFFLSQLFEVVKNPRKRYREMSKSNRKKIGNWIFVRFVFHFYCAIETDLHAFNFYLVTSDLAFLCSIVVHFQSIIILSLALRIFFFFSSFLAQYQTLLWKQYISILHRTLDNRHLFNEFNTLLFCQIVQTQTATVPTHSKKL